MAKPTPGSTYEVKKDDTLSDIAQTAYGDPNQWPVIFSHPQNHQLLKNNPNHIEIGWKLFIPQLPSASQPLPKDVRDALSPTPKPRSIYQVKKGDTLFDIAQTAYGNGNQWPSIPGHNLNKSLRDNPNQIKEGTIIYIPPIS